MNYQIFSSLHSSNVGELTELLTSPLILKWTVSFPAVLALAFLIIGQRQHQQKISDNTSIALRSVTFLGFSALAALFVSSYTGVEWRNVYPISIIYYYDKYQDEVLTFKKEYKQQHYEFTGAVNTDRSAKIIVLVIGESARKASMSLYGYERQTTPELQAYQRLKPSQFIAFQKAVSSSAFTRVSVPSLLSVAPTRRFPELARQPSLIKVLRAIGYETCLLSNQSRVGFNNDVISIMMEDVHHALFLKEKGIETTYDEGLIPYFKEYLGEDTGKKLIIVHLAGSHYKYEERYPSNEQVFTVVEPKDAYDNSIYYTDRVLGILLDKLMKTSAPACLMYVSDHGENLNDYNDGNFLHGRMDFTRFELEIPMILVFNDSFYELNRERIERVKISQEAPISHDNVSHTLIGLAGVNDSSSYQTSYDLSSEAFRQQSRFVIDSEKRVQPLDSIKLE